TPQFSPLSLHERSSDLIAEMAALSAGGGMGDGMGLNTFGAAGVQNGFGDGMGGAGLNNPGAGFGGPGGGGGGRGGGGFGGPGGRSEEHTSELQSRGHLV